MKGLFTCRPVEIHRQRHVILSLYMNLTRISGKMILKDGDRNEVLNLQDWRNTTGEYYLSEDVSNRIYALAEEAVKRNVEFEVLHYAA